MNSKHCILLDIPLTTENDSAAHIIPSALGGRLKPLGILSDTANGDLNNKFDLPLIKAFSPLMALLGGSRDSGKNQPTEMADGAGNRYRVVYGETIQLTAPEFSESEAPDGATAYMIKARTFKEARTLLGRVKKKHPDFDIEAAMQRAVMQESYPDGMLGARLQIGPIVLFPAVFVMASVYAAHCKLAVHPTFKDYVESFDIAAPSLPPDTFHWLAPQQWFRVDGNEVSHIIALCRDAHRRQALFYAELFNLVGVAVTLPYCGTENICSSYGVDVITGKPIDVHIDEAAVRSLEWKPSHQLGEISLNQQLQARMEKLMSTVFDRSRRREVSRIAQEVLGPPDGRPLTKEDITILSRRIAEFAVQTLFRRR